MPCAFVFCGAGEFDDELGGAFASGVDEGGIESAFEAVGGVGDEAEATGGGADGGGVEDGAFEEHRCCFFGDAGVFAAHDAGEGDGFLGVGDDEVVGVKFVSFAVEGGEFFVGFGLANANGVADEGRRIEGVERLAKFEEDVVGDVNDVVDGTKADGFEAFAHPLGAGGDFEVCEKLGGVAKAFFWAFDFDLPAFVVRKFYFFGGREWFGFEAEGGEFADDASVGEEVGSIGGDFDFDDGVAGKNFVDWASEGCFFG